MAGNGNKRPVTAAEAPLDARRRTFITGCAPIVGAAGLAAVALRPTPAPAAETAVENDGADGGLTPHREAYYRRARF